MNKPKRILFVVNVDWFFISHRLPIAKRALDRGWEVYLATEVTEHKDFLQREGVIVRHIEFGRGSINIFREVKAFIQLAIALIRIRPDLVHLVTVKPNIYGGLLSRILKIPGVVYAISGLGFVFIQRGLKALLRRKMVSVLYRGALGHINSRIIIQNNDDARAIQLITKRTVGDFRSVCGSGVDLDKFKSARSVEIRNPVRVLMVARLLYDKGVREFCEAARIIGAGKVNFRLVGDRDEGNPASLSIAELSEIERDGYVELLGYRSDIPELLNQADIFVLPSYREGFPKSIIEAAASGLPTVTTDVPGCRDAVVVGQTGLLVPARDSAALAQAIEWLIDNPSHAMSMGKAARFLAEEKFSIEHVVAQHLEIYSELA